MKIALTHDVDRTKKTYQYISHFFKSLKSKDIEKMKYHIQSFFSQNEPYWNFEKIINIENKYKVKSTFFFLNESVKFNLFDVSNWQLSLGRYDLHNKKIVDIIKYLDRNGWEIGVHGSYNSYKNHKLLKQEKKILEKIVGHRITGIRQHYLNLNDYTWKIQQECGFLYDSSFGLTNNIGYKENKVKVFRPFGEEFIVFPLEIMDVCFMKLNEKERWKSFYKILDTVEKKDAILVVNWHQRVFNEKEFPGYLENYHIIIEECINRNAIFLTLYDYYKTQFSK